MGWPAAELEEEVAAPLKKTFIKIHKIHAIKLLINLCIQFP